MRGKNIHSLSKKTRSSTTRLPEVNSRPIGKFENDLVVKLIKNKLSNSPAVEVTELIRLRVIHDASRFKEFFMEANPIPEEVVDTPEFPSRDIYLQVRNSAWQMDERNVENQNIAVDLVVDRKFFSQMLTDPSASVGKVQATLIVLNAGALNLKPRHERAIETHNALYDLFTTY